MKQGSVLLTSGAPKRAGVCGLHAVVSLLRLILAFAVLLAALAALAPRQSQAAVSPLGDVEAWWTSRYDITGARYYTVHYRVNDPLRSWVQRDTGENAVPSVATKDGVVIWQTAMRDIGGGLYHAAHYAIYDPQRGGWVEGSSPDDAVAGTVQTSGGAVSWMSGYRDIQGALYYYANYAIYDPQRGVWVKEKSSGIVGAFGVGVTNGTVTYRLAGRTTNTTRGYNPAGGQWYDGPTRPLAYFFSTRTSGTAPLPVAFWDMSIGATSWSWNFGDGSSSAARSPQFSFTRPGTYTVTQTVNGPGGQHSTSRTIGVTQRRN